MKHAILIVLALANLCSCGNNGQSNTIKDQQQVMAVLASLEPGHIATEEGGWTMTAKLDGREWKASYFLPPDASGRIIGCYKEEKISFPYDRRNMVAGKKMVFGENYAADLFTSDEVAIWGGRKGEMEITKVDNEWIEGNFFFTANARNTDKKIEVTDGFFRISIATK